MEGKKTRQSQRAKRINKNLRHVDEETRLFIIQSKIDELESDYYESPNRLAEDQNDSEDFEFNDQESDKKKQKKKIAKKKIPKKNKKDAYVRKNFNLKKIIKEDDLENKNFFPNFMNIRPKSSIYPLRKFCSVCGSLSRYSCPRCGERYCCLKCQNIHRDIKCLKFDI